MAKDTVIKEVVIEVNTNASDASIEVQNLTKSLENNTQANKENKDSQDKLKDSQDKTNKSSKDLRKTFTDNTVVTQGLDKVTGGLYSTFKSGYESVSQLVTGIRTYSTTQKTATASTVATSTALKGFRTALITTGIGALVVGIGLLIDHLGLLDKALGDGKKEAKSREEQISSISEAYNHLVEDTVANNKLLKKSEEETTKELIQIEKSRQEALRSVRQGAVDEAIEEVQKQFNKKGKLSFWDFLKASANNEDLTTIKQDREKAALEVLSTEEALLGKREELMSKVKVLELENELESERLKKREEAEQRNREINLRRDELYNNFAITQQEKFVSAFGAIETQRLKELKANSILLGEERLDANNRTNAFYSEEKRLLEERESTYNDFYSKYLEDGQSLFDLNTSLLEQGAFALKDLQKQYKGILDIPEVAESLEAIAENFQRRLDIAKDAVIEHKSIIESQSISELEILRSHHLEKLNLEEAKAIDELDLLKSSEHEKNDVRAFYANKRVELEKEATEAIVAIKDRELQANLALADGISGILSGMSDASKEGTGIQKGLAIASVAIDTGVAAISAFKGMVATYPGPVGIAAGVTASAGIAIQGLNQINQIKKVKTDGTETGGSASVSASATAVPNVQFVSSSENQIANTIAETTQPDQGLIKAYVVSSDITTQQQLDRNAVESSSL